MGMHSRVPEHSASKHGVLEFYHPKFCLPVLMIDAPDDEIEIKEKDRNADIFSHCCKAAFKNGDSNN